jgi:hypothetical protein
MGASRIVTATDWATHPAILHIRNCPACQAMQLCTGLAAVATK